MMRILHAGCGSNTLPVWLSGDEVRLDINPAAEPDVVADLIAMGDIGEFDAVYCAHTLEHLYPHTVGTALGEFLRVLKPGGRAFVTVPDLEGIEATEAVVYDCEVGPVTGLDMLYGYRPFLAGSPFMAHHCGFVRSTLEKALLDAGFSGAIVKRVPPMFELLGVAVK